MGLARDKDRSPRDTQGLCCDERSPRPRHDRLGRCGADAVLGLELWDASVPDAANSLPLHYPIPADASPPAPIDPPAAGPPASGPVPTNQQSADPPKAEPDIPSNPALARRVPKAEAAQRADPEPPHSPSPLRTNSSAGSSPTVVNDDHHQGLPGHPTSAAPPERLRFPTHRPG